jgi:hypothetical protein
MKDNDTKQLQALYESVNSKPGPISVTTWPSNTDSSVTHSLTYNPVTNTFIDLASSKGNIIERKEIDGADLQKYVKWYPAEIINKMQSIISKKG